MRVLCGRTRTFVNALIIDKDNFVFNLRWQGQKNVLWHLIQEKSDILSDENTCAHCTCKEKCSINNHCNSKMSGLATVHSIDTCIPSKDTYFILYLFLSKKEKYLMWHSNYFILPYITVKENFTISLHL